mmetsp:Transcript_6233/g.16673  ORF Transcript_6233/g.16673 Transcript_6233/m.16673 type:complete len:326 (+) Transcript_6233:1409-2386(+)
MAEVLPHDGVGLAAQALERDRRSFEREAPALLALLHRCVAHGLGLEHNKRIAAALHLAEGIHEFVLAGLLGWLLRLAEDLLLNLEALAPQLRHLDHELLGRCCVRRSRLQPLSHGLLLTPELTLESTLHELTLITVVPGHGDPDDLLAGRVGHCLLHRLLHERRTIKRRKPCGHSREVLHGLVLVVNDLEDPKLPDAVQQADGEGDDVHQVEETDLGPHQPLLCLVAPSDQDAIRAWRPEGPRSKDEQITVDDRGHKDPREGDGHSPGDDPSLEVEVQDHPRASDLRPAEVRGKRPKLPGAALLLGHAELLALAEKLTGKHTGRV